MIEDRVIICIGNAWDYDPTSKHHLMKLLSRKNQIIWVNYHGTRRPGMSGSDVRGALRVLRKVSRGVERVSDSICQFTPLVIPGAERPIVRRFHERLLARQIRTILNKVNRKDARPVQIWSFAPDVPHLVGQFDEECFVYYCVDDYTKFECLDGGRIAAAEAELLASADVVITTSEPLLAAKKPLRPDAHLVRHGVDFEHFASAWRKQLTRPADLAEIRAPRFGFFGLIHHWIDRALLADVARLRPDYSFVLIGEAKSDVRELSQLPNAYLLGRRPYESLPAYCAQFTAGLLPFACNEMTRCINPIKMYEYLAAGLPVISTNLPEAARFPDAIRICENAAEFSEACDVIAKAPSASRTTIDSRSPSDQVLSEPSAQARGTNLCDYSGSAVSISKLVEADSWASRVEQISEIVLEQVQNRAVICKSSPRDGTAYGQTSQALELSISASAGTGPILAHCD